MLFGRLAEIQSLEDTYNQEKSTLTILYGRSNIGKTTMIREFVKNKKYIYYSAPQASAKEQLTLFKKNVRQQLDMEDEVANEYDSYASILNGIQTSNTGVKVIIIEEFHNIVKSNKEFMNAITAIIKGELNTSRIMVICTSSSISWIENSLVSAIGTNAYTITAFVKLKELSFVDTVRMFPKYTVADSLRVFAITGGVPGYMAKFSDCVSLKDNICNQILEQGSALRSEGSDYIKEELREISLYNTILYCIASGEYKLNELHEHTGFGRDKISVYLKNLIEREVVEKIFSYDTKGNEHTRKGLYRIKSGLTEFWFRYIYANESELDMTTANEFYDHYIADTIDAFATDTFIKVGTEFIELMDSMKQLQITIDKKGRWWGKNGDIDIIACDTNNHYVIGKCNWCSDVFSYSMYKELIHNVELAEIGKEYVYLFSRGTFDEQLVQYAKDNSNIVLVGIDDL